MEKHTAGPWTIHGKKSVLTTEHDIYFEIFGRDYDISEANARLIAAAPDLLEALEKTLPYLKTVVNKLMKGEPDTMVQNAQKLLSDCETAIAKAKGL